jgi:putative transposase
MGRPPRDYHPNGIYHLTTHGIDDRLIYRDDIDRQEFCLRYTRVVQGEGWDVHAACLMDTHYHLLICPMLGQISAGMKLLNGGYSRAFNKRHKRRGALFESRYRDWTIRDEAHYLATVRYIEENPVAPGMVKTVDDWPWTTANDASPLLVSDTSAARRQPPQFDKVSDTFSLPTALPGSP